MRQLRYVRSGADTDHIVLRAADTDEQFLLPVTVQLRDAIRSDLPRLHPQGPAPADPLSPREIQTRVRAGESPERLAVDADMSLERVMRFAGPVLAERARMADEARRARARHTPGPGAVAVGDGQLVVFGEAVDARYSAHGIDPAKVGWDARRREDGSWVISARWVGGKAERQAEWLFQMGSRSVTALDETAADLLSDRPIRAVVADLPPRTLDDDPEPQRSRPAGVVVFPAEPYARTGPLPVFEERALRADLDARDVRDIRGAGEVREVGGEPGPAPSAPAVPPGMGPSEMSSDQAPPLPLALPDGYEPDAAARPRPLLGSGHRRTETDEERAARVRIPSWDDIMLGVRRNSD